jgi:prepilin signal peptidase PulO-like enzyme (type II secretory pathway)
MKSIKHFFLSKTVTRRFTLILLLLFWHLSSFAQATISDQSPVYREFIKLEPYISGLVTILVFIAAIRGIQKILRSDPEGKTDLMYAGLGAAAFVGLDLAIRALG